MEFKDYAGANNNSLCTSRQIYAKMKISRLETYAYQNPNVKNGKIFQWISLG